MRQSMAVALLSDVVVGPETGILHAVAAENTWKVILLSHSSPTNLTRDWPNTTAILPDPTKAPCYPCHLLHYGTAFCPQENGFAACAASISVERVVTAVLHALSHSSPEPALWRMSRNAALQLPPPK
jgi:ADP-heptose:LPS heptosyltransferase